MSKVLLVALSTAAALGLQATGAAQVPATASSAPGTPTESSAPPPAAPSGITVVLDKGSQVPVVTLAFPTAIGASQLPASAATAGRDLEQTLRKDLTRTGIFDILGPEQLSVLTLTGDLAQDADPYRSLGASMLLETTLKMEGDKLVLEGRLIDLASRQTIVGKRYRGSFDLARRIAHTFSDEIVLFLTSKRGVAMTSIAFYSDRDGAKEVYLMDYDGYDQRRLTAHKSISMSPSWSGQGAAVAYVTFVGGTGPAIYLADVASGRKTPLVTEGSLNISPAFSPDGRRIAFARGVGSNVEIYVCNRDGSNLHRLTNSGGIDTNPAWSPSGNEIAFTSSRSGTPQIYVMDVDGANVRRVTFEGDYNDGASWSPDGTRLAYATRVGRNRFDIALVDLVSLAARRLTSGDGSNESPSFSPDGRWLAFTSTRAGGTQIFTMNASDGSGVEQLTSDGSSWGPDWSGYLR